MRPRVALEIKTPAIGSGPGANAGYRPNPPLWEYQTRAEVRRLTAQGRLQLRRSELGNQPGPGRRMGAADSSRAASVGLLLPQPGARTRPATPSGPPRWTAGSLPQGSIKDVLITRCKACPGTLHTLACALTECPRLRHQPTEALLPANSVSNHTGKSYAPPSSVWYPLPVFILTYTGTRHTTRRPLFEFF